MVRIYLLLNIASWQTSACDMAHFVFVSYYYNLNSSDDDDDYIIIFSTFFL